MVDKKRILCIWLPNWPIQRLVVVRPELRRQAMVLCARDARQVLRARYFNAMAAHQGVVAGMPWAEIAAREWVQQGSGLPLFLVEHEAAADLQALEDLAVACAPFSPLCGLDTDPPGRQGEWGDPSGLWLDVTHSASRLGGESRLLKRVIQAFRRKGYRVAAAIANSLGAAWAVAHFHQLARSREGCWVAPDQPMGEVLDPLPIESLRLAPHTVSLLQQLGVARVQQLRQLPRADLGVRFGQQLLQRLDQATGKLSETFTPFRRAPSCRVVWNLEYPTERREVVQAGLEKLLQQLCQKLWARNRGLIRLACRLDLCDHPQIDFQVGLFQATSQFSHVQQLLRMHLERCDIPAAVRRIELQATVTARLRGQQAGLWPEWWEPSEGAGAGAGAGELARWIDRMSSRLGADAVRGVRLLAEAGVEESYEYVPLTGETFRREDRRLPAPVSTSAARNKHQQTSARRPLHLLPAPSRLHATPLQACGPYHDRPPGQFRYLGRQHFLRRAWGPERIQTGWWRGQLVERDYFEVEDQRGHRFWLFQDLPTRLWYLHGWFG